MLLGLFAAAAIQASQPQSRAVDPNCAAAGACRHVDKVQVRASGGRVGELTVDTDMPWTTADGDIILWLGDTAVFRLDAVGDKLKPVLIEGGPDSVAHHLAANEIRVRFIQDATFQINLIVDNKLSRAFHYDAVIGVLGAGAGPTDICAANPGSVDMEAWEEPVSQIVLTGFTFTDRLGACWSDLPPTPPARAAPPPAQRTPRAPPPLGPRTPPA